MNQHQLDSFRHWWFLFKVQLGIFVILYKLALLGIKLVLFV